MTSLEVKTLEGYMASQSTVTENGGRLATFNEVLTELLNMKPDSEGNIRLRYQSIHMVPFTNNEDSNLIALIGNGEPLVKDSFRIDFVQFNKINWEQVEKDNDWIFWYTME